MRQRGPLLVAFAAALWATDSLFRSHLVGTYTPLEIVWTSHLVCLVVTLPVLWGHRDELRRMSWYNLGQISYIAVGGGALAMVLFTQAFATTSNYSVPILIQKLQPFVALVLARILLGEKPRKHFYAFALCALVGAYLVSFGWQWTFHGITEKDQNSIFYALGAAAIWGSTTVFGRHLSQTLSWPALTSLRYVLATCFLTIWGVSTGALDMLQQPQFFQDLKVFAPMAWGPGLAALYLYYFGLKHATAAAASFAELAFPVGAVVVNWIFLDTPLSLPQILGTGLLLIAVMRMGETKANAAIEDAAYMPLHGKQ